uniref:Uncharacterized protein n=1 Tax=Anguilla anguilla TaxID=7936 RepID=A0A0E9RKL3_ANGAN
MCTRVRSKARAHACVQLRTLICLPFQTISQPRKR